MESTLGQKKLTIFAAEIFPFLNMEHILGIYGTVVYLFGISHPNKYSGRGTPKVEDAISLLPVIWTCRKKTTGSNFL